MKRIFAIIVSKFIMKLARFLGHNGTNFCGEAAMKICPGILKWYSTQVKKGILLVAGTNGKTSVNNMINAILKEAGYSVVCNELGANLDSGIVSAFIESSDIYGHIKADFACIEIDEAVLPKLLEFIKPTFIIFTNFFRDQLDRYCEIDMILSKIKASLKELSGIKLILNADDPSLVEMGESLPNTKYYYGMETMNASDNYTGAAHEHESIKDSVFCKRCGNRLQYERYYYGQLGCYFCQNCGFKRPLPDFRASIEKSPLHLIVAGGGFFKADIYTGFINSYMAYNALAAVSCTALLDIPPAIIEKALVGYKSQIGRMEKFFINKPVVFNLVKNPVGFNESLKIIVQDPREKTIAIGINDCVQDGRDVSWLWDTNFELLLDFDDKTIRYIVFGRRRHDMALRLKYAGIEANKIRIADSTKLAVDYSTGDKSPVAYIFANYSLLFETRSILKRRSRDVADYHMPSVS